MSRSASTGKGVGRESENNAPITSADADFQMQLLLKLAAQGAPARMGKFVVKKPTDDHGELRSYLVIRDNWMSDKADCLKVHDVLAYSLDKIDMHNYKTHEAIGIEFHLPLAWVKGFQWATEKEHETFFDIHAYKETN